MIVNNFNELGLSAPLVTVLDQHGLTTPTEVQQRAIPIALEGRDLAAAAETGSGKTAAFLLPIIERLQRPGAPRALVLAPTRELASQIEEAAKTYGRAFRLRAVSIVGGESVPKQIKALKQGVDIIIATPGRLNDLIERRAVSLKEIEILVLDEADRMLDMGFLPQVRQIVQQLPTERQTMLLSATFAPSVERMVREMLVEPARITVRSNTTVATLTQRAFSVLAHHKEPLLLALLKHEPLGSYLIFMRTKRGVDRVARILQAHGHAVDTIHSDRSQSQRNSALAGFRAGRTRILIATDIAARGIDVDHVSHVINFEVPTTAEDYVHRVGRTARAGRLGSAWTLVSPSEEVTLASIEGVTGVRLRRSRLTGFSDGRTEEQIKAVAQVAQVRTPFTRSFSPRRASR